MTSSIVGAVITSLIILGGLYAIARNLFVFFVDQVRGHPGTWWFDRPYLFRSLAWTFTLFWLFGPYDVLQLGTQGLRWLAFGFYIVAAAAWLWILRVSFLDGIAQRGLKSGPSWARWLGFGGHATLTFLIQLVCAGALGYVFLRAGLSSPLVWVVVVAFLIGTAGMSLWRMSVLIGPGHTFGERMQHVLGGREAGPPHQ